MKNVREMGALPFLNRLRGEKGGLRRTATFVVSFTFILSIVLSSVPLAFGASGPQSTVMIRGTTGTLASLNWSGYAVNGSSGSITAVQGSWTVPSVSCPSTGSAYAAVWVGIDGFQSSTVEQTGTDSDCHSGAPSYFAWFEFYPNPSVKIKGLAIHPGDEIQARVTFSSGAFKVFVADLTTGQTFSKSATVSNAARSSAEFIVEAPLVCTIFKCKLASLSNFGTVGFGQDYTGVSMTCGLIKNGVSGSIGSFGSAVQEITMVSQKNHNLVKAQPSVLTSDGLSFTVQWLSAGP
jgi:hypothetical protein